MMSRWMLWHRLHCSVQYSEAFRLPKTRNTDRRPRHSGQCERTVEDGSDSCPVSSCVIGAPQRPGRETSNSKSGSEPRCRRTLTAGPAQSETVDLALGVCDGRLAAGPGEADLERRKADTV